MGACNTMLETMGTVPALHAEFLEKVAKSVATTLRSFYNESDTKRKALEAEEAKLRHELENAKRNLLKEKDSCSKLHQELLKEHQVLVQQAVGGAAVKESKIDKAAKSLQKAKEKAQKAFAGYDTMVTNAHNLQTTFHTIQLPNLATQLEDIEHKRLTMIKENMEIYVNLFEEMMGKMKVSHEKASAVLPTLNKQTAIDQFVTSMVSKHGVPPSIPPILYDLSVTAADIDAGHFEPTSERLREMAEQQRQATAMMATYNSNNPGASSTTIADPKAAMGMLEKKYQKEQPAAPVAAGGGGVVVRDGRKYPSKGMKVKGLYDYQTDEDDGLSFKEGQIITIVEADGDWWVGTLSGKQGEFPHNYVEIIESAAPAAAGHDTHAAEPKKEAASGGGLWSRLKGGKKDDAKAAAVPGGPPSGPPPGHHAGPAAGGKPSAGAAAAAAAAEAASTEKIVKCQALFDFSAPKDDEDEGEYISFKKGDIIKTTPSKDDWWWGEINGQAGFFPFSYCQLVPEGH